MSGASGRILARAIEKRAMLQLKMTLGPADIAADEFYALQAIEAEIQKFEQEKVKRSRRK